jgi:hypothetical protein
MGQVECAQRLLAAGDFEMKPVGYLGYGS